MTTLLATERAKYDAIWGLDVYAKFSPGLEVLPLFLDMTGARPPDSILDAGCGSAKASLALHEQGFDVRLCDLTNAGIVPDAQHLRFDEACLWKDLRSQLSYLQGGSVDWVYCCDVLEHIPTPFTMLVVTRLLEIARKGVFLSIAHVPDEMGVWVGQSLHATVQSFTEWRDQLASIARIVEARDLIAAGLFYLQPC